VTLRLAVALLFWIAVGLIQKFNWGMGGAKALAMLALLAATPFVVAAVERRALGADPDKAERQLSRHSRERGNPSALGPRFRGDDEKIGKLDLFGKGVGARSRLLAFAVAALLVLQAGYALKELRHPSLIDAATTTLASGDLLRAGSDPYAARVDSVAAAQTGARFAGYKYLPVTLVGYLPLGAPLGERGIVLANLLLHLATVWLVFRLAVALAGVPAAGAIAALLYLALPLVPFQLFAKGDTDPVAVVPMIAALLLYERHALLAGFCLGLSLAAKLLPAALLLPCCLPATPRARAAYVLGLGLGALPLLPFLLWSPAAFLDNIVVFNLLRAPDSTSWLMGMPALLATLVHALVGAFCIGVAIFVWRRAPSLAVRTGLGIALILAAILAGPAAHHNYQLWWLPLAAALLGAALAPWRSPSAAI
jgi:hypothetical protein